MQNARLDEAQAGIKIAQLQDQRKAQSQQQRRQWSNGWEILRVWSKVLEWHPNVCSSQQAGHGCKQSLKEGGNGRRGRYQLQGRWTSSWLISGFPGGSDGKESAYNAGDPGLILGLGRSLDKGWQPTPVFLPGELHGQRILAGYSSWGCKKSDMTEWLALSLSHQVKFSFVFHKHLGVTVFINMVPTDFKLY